jgi:hypothetical protein
MKAALDRDVNQPGWGVISGLTMVGTICGFAFGEQDVSFWFPLDETERERLRLFCRYPQGLSKDQWSTMLRHLGQEDFRRLAEE